MALHSWYNTKDICIKMNNFLSFNNFFFFVGIKSLPPSQVRFLTCMKYLISMNFIPFTIVSLWPEIRCTLHFDQCYLCHPLVTLGLKSLPVGYCLCLLEEHRQGDT